jgi:ribosomal-protein-alanine N-acetyltransferase
MSPDPKRPLRAILRWIHLRDYPEVLDIENTSREYPWSDRELVHSLLQPERNGVVAEHEGRIIGYTIYELHKHRVCVCNLAVAPDCRRRGVGTQMLGKLIGKLSAQRRNRITLEVRETNLPAQLFFRDGGFRAISVMRGFYDDSPEDAYLMGYRFKPKKRTAMPPHNRISRLSG